MLASSIFLRIINETSQRARVRTIALPDIRDSFSERANFQLGRCTCANLMDKDVGKGREKEESWKISIISS